MKPAVADNRTRNLLILRAPVVDRPSVTAEAAGSSPVVPAIHQINFEVFNSLPSPLPVGLAAGKTVDEIVAEFPDITRDQIAACLDYARELAEFEAVV